MGASPREHIPRRINSRLRFISNIRAGEERGRDGVHEGDTSIPPQLATVISSRDAAKENAIHVRFYLLRLRYPKTRGFKQNVRFAIVPDYNGESLFVPHKILVRL